MEMEEREKQINEKVKFFYHEKCKVHVNRFDKTFWNGIITGIRSEGIFNFIDDKFGETLLFTSDIHDINLFKGEDNVNR